LSLRFSLINNVQLIDIFDRKQLKIFSDLPKVNGAFFILAKRPSDCGELDKATCKSGVYKIYPKNTSGFEVYCEMEKNGGGWTVSDVILFVEINRWQEIVMQNSYLILVKCEID